MGQNSTEVAYSFGQFGSAYSDLAKPIVPPTGLVITAITFLADNTPTVLTPEKLDTEGPSYISIQGTSGDIQVADNHANFNGIVARDVTDGSISAGSNVTIASASNKIKKGQYVLLVAAGDTDTTGITIDSETPIPITRGPNRQGVKVASYTPLATTLTLDADITPSTQGLIFLDDFHGAGGLTAASQVFPKGVTIYGRWTTFTPSATGVICYFGK
mgnify:FL=1